MKSVNPFNNKLIKEYSEYTPSYCYQIIEEVGKDFQGYRQTSLSYRKGLMLNAANLLMENKNEYACLITSEMGKVISESLAEIEKCAWVCRYYAENAKDFLSDNCTTSSAKESLIAYEPLGIVLAIMPWNFPFWQVFRFAAPALMAGNAGILKHASNVTGCAYAIEELFRKAGFPENIFRVLAIRGERVSDIVSHKLIKAITLTGSETAGSQVASQAGKLIKKSVLELGGSDPFIVLKDANLQKAAQTAITARMLNAGQSCIAAKRFIIQKEIVNEFTNRVKKGILNLKTGDPMDLTVHVGPLASQGFCDVVDRQVSQSVAMGAKVLAGGTKKTENRNFYLPTLLTDISENMPVFTEEVFGPVMGIIRCEDDEEAVRLANNSIYGLGASIWTEDRDKALSIARKLQCGSVFINEMVKSDPRLPFGGIKASGYGRELSDLGIKEFVNIKTICVF